MSDDYFFSFRNNLAPTAGRLLISEPYLPDRNFERSVVLMCDHNEDGSFGFVMNRRSPLKLNEVVEGMGDLDAELYIGGPVQQDTLHFVFRNHDYLEDSKEISDGLYWGGNYDQLQELARTGQINPSDFRFFIGYSGWGAAQLEEEIEANSWIVSEGLALNLLLDTASEDLWKVILENMGGKYEMFSRYPVDPRLN